MIINCPHCRQAFEVRKKRAGQDLQCPLCSHTFKVPASASVSHALPRRSRWRSKILVLVLLGAAVWFASVSFENWRGPTPRGEAVAQLLEQLAERLRAWLGGAPRPQPTPTPTPTPAPTPAPTATPTPTPTPTPEPVDPISWLLEHPDRVPKQLKLAAPTRFPAMLDGRQVGNVRLPAGAKVDVVSIGATDVTLGFKDGKVKLPHAQTDLPVFAAAEMAKPEAFAPLRQKTAVVATPASKLVISREDAGALTIRGGDVAFTLSAAGKPLSFTPGNGTNLLNTKDPGPGFYLATGTGPDEKTMAFASAESKDGKLILTAADKTRVTLAVSAGDRYIAFDLEQFENAPGGAEPVLKFRVNFNNVRPEFVPFDYMCITSGKWESLRLFGTASWPYLWKRGDRDPLGGFAFFVPENEDDHNETLLRVWTGERVPHPKAEGKWTYERAKAWVEEWEKTFENTHQLTISAAKPEDLGVLIEYAKKLKVNRVYLHTDTWRGAYWVYDRDPLSVNKAVFPRGEEDLKAFIGKLRANGMDAMLHTLCYGFGAEGSKYIGKGKKTDRRLSNWGKGKLEKPVSATDTTILFRPNPGVKFPGPNDYGGWFKFNDVRIDDEIIQGRFEDTDQPVWKITKCVRGPSATNHEAGTEVVGLLKSYGQNYYPDSMTDLPEITAKEYAEFFNRLGVQHHEYDGAESHNDVPWGYPKWAMYVYQNTERPMTSDSSGGTPNPWDLVYRMFSNPDSDGKRLLNLYRRGSGSAALAVHRPGRLATSPIENHFTLAQGAAANSRGFGFGKPEPMFGIFPNVIKQHGLSELIADQFAIWRELTPKLTPELRKQISDAYYLDKAPNTMNHPSSHRSAKIVYEARRAEGGYELQPFTIMTRGKEDADWTTVQEFAGILPRQYVGPVMRVRLDNPFGRQAPQFIIRVLSGYSDSAAAVRPAAVGQEVTKDFEGYMIGAGADAKKTAVAAAPAANAGNPFMMQPKAAQMREPGRHQFKDVGSALEVSLDNLNKEEIFQQSGFPSFAFKGNPANARGVALTVTGDGSGAFLIVQVGPNKDYVVPIDFTGRKDIFIPIGEASRTTGRWGMRYATKFYDYGPVNTVSIGFGRVMANTRPQVLIENLRMVGETPSSVKNLTVHAGAGTLTVKGEVKTDQYLWYQGGDTVGVYDLNWNLVQNLPVQRKDYQVDQGFSEFWIDGECADPPPWFDVQFITKGDPVPLNN